MKQCDVNFDLQDVRLVTDQMSLGNSFHVLGVLKTRLKGVLVY